MDDSDPAIILNANQRRHFEVLFARLEDSVERIERLLDTRQPQYVLTVVRDDVSDSFRASAPSILVDLRQKVVQLARVLDLSPRTVSRTRMVAATLTAEAIRIEDNLSAQLRGYGNVHSSVVQYLDPTLEEMARTLSALRAELDHHSRPRPAQ